MEQRRIDALKTTLGSDYGNIVGLIAQKDGEIRYEDYFHGFGPDDAVHAFSVTKSVVSALIGIAIERGSIRDVSQRVLDFFPDYTPKRDEKTIQRITLRDLLTMTAPYKYKSAPYTRYFTSESWVKTALDLLGGKGAVGTFRYTPIIGPDILTGVLAAATGKPVLDFAEEALFGPLGLAPRHSHTFSGKDEQLAWYKKGKYGGEWIADPQGVNTAGWGLTLTAADMARLGQLYLDGGLWNGKQLIPAAWIAESTAVQSRWEALDLAYGYLWWHIDGDCFAALGDGGNAIYVNRRKGLVVAIAALFQPRAKDSVELIRTQIEPLLEGGAL